MLSTAGGCPLSRRLAPIDRLAPVRYQTPMSDRMMLILFAWGVFVLVVMLVIRKLMGGRALDQDDKKRDQP